FTVRSKGRIDGEQGVLTEKATLISERGLYLCRQLPTLPHTFACSTIGPAGLNFRVRDGNGWNPRGKITDNLEPSAISRQPSAQPCCGDLIPPMRGKLVKERLSRKSEDEASQLNRLGRRGKPRLYYLAISSARSHQYCFSVIQVRTTSLKNFLFH